ncbi:hypothetical protein [uncultured Flavobacterium sp.]|uniref:hypothetical protein n=1 Tax=uncultured Flavobacterium sp. TaxID=165435 RepID=UPI0030EB6837
MKKILVTFLVVLFISYQSAKRNETTPFNELKGLIDNYAKESLKMVLLILLPWLFIAMENFIIIIMVN